MPQSLAQIYLHLVFSTKDRRPYLADRELRGRAHARITAICRRLQSPAIRVGGVADHVHILCRLTRTLSIAELVKEIKRDSSLWIKERKSGSEDFYWQEGYGAFSVSPAHVPALEGYIQDQEKHHHRETFQDEYRRILKKYEVEFDEKYVWA